MSKPIDYTYDYDLAKMAGASYSTPEKIMESMKEQEEDKRELPGKWEILRGGFSDSTAQTGFVAYAFVNEDTKQIVIAYRGTDGLHDHLGANKAIAQDGNVDLFLPNALLGKHPREQITGLVQGMLPDWHPQFTQGLDFAEKIMQQYGKEYQISVTGHSLGGSIAQVVSHMHHLQGRTFDPGGAQNLVESEEFAQWRRAHGKPSPDLAHPDLQWRHDDQGFRNYMVNDSLVSKHSGPHIGAADRVSGYAGRDVDAEANYVAKRIIPLPAGAYVHGKEVVELHDMDRIIRVFKDARETGLLNRIGAITPEPAAQDQSLAAARPKLPDDFRDPAHPGHASYHVTLEAVHALEQSRNIAHGPHSERLAAALTVEMERARFGDLHHVEIGADRQIRAVGRRFYAGDPDPVVAVDVDKALARSVEDNSTQWLQMRSPHLFDPPAPAIQRTLSESRQLDQMTADDQALFATLKDHLPPQTSDAMLAHTMLLTKEGGITRPEQIAWIEVMGRDAFVMGNTPGFRAKADLSAQPPTLQETLQQSQAFDQQQEQQLAQFRERQAQINQGHGGPRMALS